MSTPKTVTAYLRRIGRKGGLATTPAKIASSRKNAQLGGRRRRYCAPCDTWGSLKVCKSCGGETQKEKEA
jgi:hypothetical protein